MRQLPSKVEFASYLQYSPRGTGVQSVLSQNVTYAIKQDKFLPQLKARAIPFAAAHIKQNFSQYPFLMKYLSSTTVLVPAPRSSPLPKGALWPAARICDALLAEGLGLTIVPCLERTSPVQRSATAAPGGRPGPQEHYDSTRVHLQYPLVGIQSLTIVDDVVTRGATFLGLVARLSEAFPNVPIQCFALVRTMSQGEVAAVRDPVEGTISMAFGKPRRNP